MSPVTIATNLPHHHHHHHHHHQQQQQSQQQNSSVLHHNTNYNHSLSHGQTSHYHSYSHGQSLQQHGSANNSTVQHYGLQPSSQLRHPQHHHQKLSSASGATMYKSNNSQTMSSYSGYSYVKPQHLQQHSSTINGTNHGHSKRLNSSISNSNNSKNQNIANNHYQLYVSPSQPPPSSVLQLGTNPSTNQQPLLLEPIVPGIVSSVPNKIPRTTSASLSLALNANTTSNSGSTNSFELATTPVGGTLSLIASGFANANISSSTSAMLGLVGGVQQPPPVQLHRFGAAQLPTPTGCVGSVGIGSNSHQALYHPSPSAVTEALNQVPTSVLSSADTYICCAFTPRCFIIQKVKPGTSIASSLENERKSNPINETISSSRSDVTIATMPATSVAIATPKTENINATLVESNTVKNNQINEQNSKTNENIISDVVASLKQAKHIKEDGSMPEVELDPILTPPPELIEPLKAEQKQKFSAQECELDDDGKSNSMKEETEEKSAKQVEYTDAHSGDKNSTMTRSWIDLLDDEESDSGTQVPPLIQEKVPSKPKKNFAKCQEPLDTLFMPMFVRNKSPTCRNVNSTAAVITVNASSNSPQTTAPATATSSAVMSASASISSLSHASTPEESANHSEDDDDDDLKRTSEKRDGSQAQSKAELHVNKSTGNGNKSPHSNQSLSKAVVDPDGQQSTVSGARESNSKSRSNSVDSNNSDEPKSTIYRANASSVDNPSGYHECPTVTRSLACGGSAVVVGGAGGVLHENKSLVDVSDNEEERLNKPATVAAAVVVVEQGRNSTPKSNTLNHRKEHKPSDDKSPQNTSIVPSQLNQSESVESVVSEFNSFNSEELNSVSDARTSTSLITESNDDDKISVINNTEVPLHNSSSTAIGVQATQTASRPKELLTVSANNNQSITKSNNMATVESNYVNDNGVVDSFAALSLTQNGDAIQDGTPPVLRNVRNLPEEELHADLKRQLEYYFSVCNLAKDRYLISKMDDQEFVPIWIVAGFNEVRRLTHDYNLVVEVLRSSPEVIVDDAGLKVRPNHKRCVVILRDVPENITEAKISSMFDMNTCPVKLVKCEFASNSSWYLHFQDDEDAMNAISFMKEKLVNYPDTSIPIMARIKAKPVVKQFRTMEFVPSGAPVARPIAPSPVGSVLSNPSATISPVSHYSMPAVPNMQDAVFIQDGSVGATNGAYSLPPHLYSPYTAANRMYPIYPHQILSVTPSQNGVYDLTSVFVANSLTPHTAYPGHMSTISNVSTSSTTAVPVSVVSTAPGQPAYHHHPAYIPMVSVAGGVPSQAASVARYNGNSSYPVSTVHNGGGYQTVNSHYNTFPNKNYRGTNNGSQNQKRSKYNNPNHHSGWHSAAGNHQPLQQQQQQQQQHQQPQQQHALPAHSSAHQQYNAQHVNTIPATNGVHYSHNTQAAQAQLSAPATASLQTAEVSANHHKLSAESKPPKSKSVNAQITKTGGKEGSGGAPKSDGTARQNGKIGRSYTTSGERPNRSSSNTYRTSNGRYSTGQYTLDGEGAFHMSERTSSLKYPRNPMNFGKEAHSHNASERNNGRSNSSAGTAQDFVLASTAFPPLPGAVTTASVSYPENLSNGGSAPSFETIANNHIQQNGVHEEHDFKKVASRPASSASHHSVVDASSAPTSHSGSTGAGTATVAAAPTKVADHQPITNGDAASDLSTVEQRNSDSEPNKNDSVDSLADVNGGSMTYAQKLKAAKLAKNAMNGGAADHCETSNVLW